MPGIDTVASEMSKFGPEWVLAGIVAVTLSVRLPAILKVVLTYLNEREKVKAAIENDRRKLDASIDQRRARSVERKGAQQ